MYKRHLGNLLAPQQQSSLPFPLLPPVSLFGYYSTDVSPTRSFYTPEWRYIVTFGEYVRQRHRHVNSGAYVCPVPVHELTLPQNLRGDVGDLEERLKLMPDGIEKAHVLALYAARL